MTKWRMAGLGLAAALVLVTGETRAAETDALGKWRATNGKITVNVENCGQSRICATIVDLSKPLDSAGKPRLDRKNPNAALRSRPLMGLRIIDGMRQVDDRKWKGDVYYYQDGGTYSATATVKGDALQVKGCWGPFCKKLNFRRMKDVAAN